MFRSLMAFALASSSLIATVMPALSQQVCAPEKVAAAIDVYSKAPFGARAWRKLNGLGDPGIEAETGYSYDNYQERAQWSALVKSLAPDATELAEPGYSCRLSYPLATLRDRVASLPPKDPYIKQWLAAQAVVFKACSDTGAQALALPAALDVTGTTKTLQDFDRAYQQASIAFYKDPPKAIELYRAIGAVASPHKAAARYNVSNLLANARNVVEARKEADAILADPALAPVHDITKDLKGYIANIEDTAQGWQTLIDDTITTLNQPLAEISRDERSKTRFANALFDIEFAGVKAKHDDWWVAGTLPENPTLSKAIVDSARKQPMALWMMTGQTLEDKMSKAPWSFHSETWQAWNTSLVDRAMALQPASAGITGLPRILIDNLKLKNDATERTKLWSSAKDAASKAQATCGDAPDTAAVGELALQATRLSAQAGTYDDIYSNLMALPLAQSRTLNVEILPRLMQHILATGNVEEGRRLRDKLLSTLAYSKDTNNYEDAALRSEVASFLEWVAENNVQWLAAATAQDNKLGSLLYDVLPSSQLKVLSEDQRFDTRQKAQLTRTAWTRDYARSRKLNVNSFKQMLTSNPELSAAHAQVLKDYPAASPEHAALLTILRNPRFNILVASPDLFWDAGSPDEASFSELSYYDHNDSNWWCPYEPDRVAGAIRASYDAFTGVGAARDWQATDLKPVLEADAISNAEKQRDKMLRKHPAIVAASSKELSGLAKAASAPKTLTQAAMAWAKRSDGKDGAPEALALAVRATRFGCNWHGSHKPYSKPAQEMLKAKFGSTQWAAKTPYWFDCQFPSYDKDGNELKTCVPAKWPKQAPLK